MKYKDITKHTILVPLYKIVLINELGRLLQGICDIKGTKNFLFIDLVDITKGRKIIYDKLVCDF